MRLDQWPNLVSIHTNQIQQMNTISALRTYSAMWEPWRHFDLQTKTTNISSIHVT